MYPITSNRSMNPFLTFLIAITLLFGMYSCANIKPITGGPMDMEEPQIRSVTPENFNRNFKDGEIIITFNENIKTENISQDFFVSPPMKKPPKIKTKKKSVVISIEGPLEENTTYTLTFKEVIADVNENNTIQILNYVFSTGPDIDSLFIQGVVKNPFTNQPLPNVLVGLFDDNPDDTLTISNSAPKYFSFTDKEGNYVISNVKEANYNLAAIKDDDRNLKYDGGNELIDVIMHLKLDTPIVNQNLYPVKIDTLKPVILRDQPDVNRISIEFSEGISNAYVVTETSKKILLSKKGNNPKSLIVYNTEQTTDSLNILVFATDSVGNTSNDTLKSIFLPVANKDSLPALIITKEPANMKLDYSKPVFTLSFNYPVSFTGKEFKTNPQVKWTSSVTKTDSLFTDLTIEINTRLKDSLTVFIPDSLFAGLFTQGNEADTITYTLINESEVGTIEGIIESELNFFLLQLLDDKLSLIEEKKNEKSFKFLSLKAGNYFFRIIADTNQNGRWDQPDLENGQRAEEIIFYNDPIKVKENWEVSGIKLKF